MTDPSCDKCGAPITTGLMSVFCPLRKDCEFWEPDLDESIAEFRALFNQEASDVR